jgi:glycine/D-amino acid oxidase-like deaminating enzyme/nitrite reductase/ring-hydroxylating ferredoxin subunit
MTNSSGTTTSIWTGAAEGLRRQSLEQNLSADVCIVGAGIAGITTAYLLCMSGASVVVIDSADIGGGETGRTTAHLSNALDDRYCELEQLHGHEKAKLAAESHTVAIDQIENIARAEDISCDFERLDGFLFRPSHDDSDILERELAASHRAGLNSVEFVPRAPFQRFETGPCLRFPNQAQFHPLLYLAGLAKAVERRGGLIFTGTHAVWIEAGPPAVVTSDRGFTVTAKSLVVASNTPVNDRFTIHTKQAAYRSYVVGLSVPRSAATRALYWDTLDPYHYVRLQSDSSDTNSETLIVGGEDHKTGQAHSGDPFGHLIQWARDRFPMAGDLTWSWSGQIMEPVDGLAFIGRNPGDESVYIATGDSGHGMTHGTIAGMLLSDLIRKERNPWADLYDPARINLGSLRTFAEENVNVAMQYGSFLTPGQINSAADLFPGTGGILRHGLSKSAVYKDPSGNVHELDAVCPHLGCIVKWNSTEHTWDCPCHGSRFSAVGEVLNGPALAGLSPLKR